jgi:hypothetical protein
MNWRRGFLRLWVVLSLAWLVACGGWGVLHWHSGISAKFPVTDPNGLRFIINAPVGTAKADILYFVRNSGAVKRWQADCSTKRDVSCEKEIRVQMPGVIDDVVRFLVLIVSIPFVVLVLGLVFSWVILGFRKPVDPTS